MRAAVVLKPGRDKAVRHRHHWIFSGAIRDLPAFEDGDILAVRALRGRAPRARLLQPQELDHRADDRLRRGAARGGRARGASSGPWRSGRRLFDPAVTNARRLDQLGRGRAAGPRRRHVRRRPRPPSRDPGHGEAQAGPRGPPRRRPSSRGPSSNASDLPARREEGLEPTEAVLAGEPVDRVRILEAGMPLLGRAWPRARRPASTSTRGNRGPSSAQFAAGRRVLNAFSYTGSFSVCALLGGALRADSVDSLGSGARRWRKRTSSSTASAADSGVFFTADVFEFLREPALDHDFVILDPPAFAKRRTDVVAACRGYKDINRLALQRLKAPGLLLTFSCSHFVDEVLFQQVVFQAAHEAGRRVRILQKHRQAFDHPVNVYHPETAYLKGFLLYVD
ncbi:MAG: class I SAM-dependent methyltransferase [Chromatiales bacterium]|nr:class I SAM-dependent methyltransferase [Chromatiales bacterium]